MSTNAPPEFALSVDFDTASMKYTSTERIHFGLINYKTLWGSKPTETLDDNVLFMHMYNDEPAYAMVPVSGPSCPVR